MKKKAFLILAISLISIYSSYSQETVRTDSEQVSRNLIYRCKQLGIANKLELGITAGTTGLGLEVATPVTEWVKIRAGVDFIPSFNLPMHFGITTYTDGAVNSGNFGKIQNLMYEFAGYEMDDQVDMHARPKMSNFKFLVDVYPFKNNRHWHVTLGFYSGPKRIGKAINAMGEMPSLLTINMYNRLYDYALSDGFIENPIYNDIYLDPVIADELSEKFREYGRLGIHIGDFKDGTPYYMEPDKDGTVSAKAYVNSFKYYTGIGYGGAISKDKRWNLAVDGGVLFWGGAPKVIIHDGVNMTNDLINVRGKVGEYLDLLKALKVYPVVSVKLSYTFF